MQILMICENTISISDRFFTTAYIGEPAHFALLKKYPKPEDNAPVVEPFYTIAKRIDFAMYDLNVLLTKPAMTKMLPDKMPGM